MTRQTTGTTQWPPKRRTAAQRASDANHEKQMIENKRDGRQTPPPRDPEAGRRAYEARHSGGHNRR